MRAANTELASMLYREAIGDRELYASHELSCSRCGSGVMWRYGEPYSEEEQAAAVCASCRRKAREDLQVVQCNLREGMSSASEGARAYLVMLNPGWGNDRIQVLIRSRGGRWIQKWERIDRLERFRVKTLPATHPLYFDRRLFGYDDLHAIAARLNDTGDYYRHQREVKAIVALRQGQEQNTNE